MLNDIIIAISGKSGCGNSTVSRLVAEEFKLKLINYTFHNLADERNTEFNTLCLLAESDPQYDYQVDEMQVKLAAAGNCVLGSRLAIWLVKQAALKVYLKATEAVRAGRIHRREGGAYEEVLAQMRERDRRDTERYKRLYNLNNDEYSFADLIIDTDDLNQHDVAERVIARIRTII